MVGMEQQRGIRISKIAELSIGGRKMATYDRLSIGAGGGIMNDMKKSDRQSDATICRCWRYHGLYPVPRHRNQSEET